MEINIIVACCKNFGIGYQKSIPWNVPEDLRRFYQLTRDSIVVMGRETYYSLPESHRPLKNRFNIVLTNDPKRYNSEVQTTLTFMTFVEFDAYLQQCPTTANLFFIGGESIYNACLRYDVSKIYMTYIDREYQCDRHFTLPPNFQLVNVSDNLVSETEKCNYRFLEYDATKEPHGETQYLGLLRDIINNGNVRQDRTGTGTVGLFGKQIRFDISKSIPLLTTKFVPFKMIVKELLWFLKGQTDNKILQDQGVHIWDGNTTREFLDNRGLSNYKVGDIGAMYGFQLRHFGAKYDGFDKDYTGQGIDQLEQVIHLLRTDPYSRRIAMTTYNVADLDKGVLHPCHGIYTQFYVEKDGPILRLSCHMTQRSVDCGCGLPFNIASYAILTHIIAQRVGMVANELIISTGDTHIYNNHLEGLLTQLTRQPYPFPMLKMRDIREKKWEEIVLDDFEVVGYFNHPAIKLVMNI
jgi:dihydrofolate reductase/thymidylate synthase